MKKLRPLSLLTFSLILLSARCKTDSVNPDQLSLLPPATQTGAKTLGCLVNGQAFVAQPNAGLYTPALTCYYTSAGGGQFNLGGVHGSSALNMGTDSVTLREGATVLLSKNGTPGMASGSYSLGLTGFNTNANATGQLTITHMDTIKHIISGTFYFKGVNVPGDTAKITDGRFDMPYND